VIARCVRPLCSRRRSATAGLAVALLISFVPGRLSAQTGEGEVGPAIGSTAPPAALADLDGNTVQLLGYVKKGQPALFEFWAAWCENCAALQPQMDEIQKTFGDRLSVVAVAVAVGESVRRVKRHLADHDPGYPYLWDGDGAAVRAYNASTTSVVVILDADGRVAYTGVGPDQDLIGAVKQVLGAG
jgi:cytochrome c biogenesis protein CcmG/thiol:disulfide interchange protein DsbE